ncbi:HAMP domain-containing histidine kinase [bacterium]|nr:MAG: HAMP domain-containing histidine kinase [bacterium]
MIQSNETRGNFIAQLPWAPRMRAKSTPVAPAPVETKVSRPPSPAKSLTTPSSTPQQLLAATAAHDMGTPVSLIANAAWALKHGCNEEEAQYWVQSIIRNAYSLQILVDDFKELARDETHPAPFNYEEVNLAALVSEVVTDYQKSVQTHPLTFSGDEAWVLGNSEQLKRLIFNLISNAVKYSEQGREVKIDVWQRGANICLFVQDNGKGVTPAESERIFLPFTRLEQHAGMARGEGLGLASVKRIADAHGATLRVQGAPCQGSIFEVCFKAMNRVANERESPALNKIQ